jgi:hypothetical protein
MRRIRVNAETLLLAGVAAGIAVTTAAAAAPTRTTWVVDRDRVQCAHADFTSIQAAVDAAEASDLIRVCPDRYSESVVIDKPLTIKGDPEAIEALDCLQPTLPEFGVDQHAIVDPDGDAFSIALKLSANNVTVEGLVVEGASVGIDAGDRFSGNRVDHNVIRRNTLFGIDFGSAGDRQSRVDHNCIRENRWGLVSELDDDSLWTFPVVDGYEREGWNQRDLINARVDHNSTFANQGAGLEAAGPGRRANVVFDHNRSLRDAGALIQNSADSAILENEITDPPSNAIVVGGGNQNLVIEGNRVRGSGLHGIVFIETFIDRFALPSTNVTVRANDVRSSTRSGIFANTNNLAESRITENTIIDNTALGFSGISLFAGNTNIEVSRNQVHNNARSGIRAQPGAIGNRFEANSMHGNGFLNPTLFFDAHDLNPPINVWPNNFWIGNDCLTDNHGGAICGGP